MGGAAKFKGFLTGWCKKTLQTKTFVHSMTTGALKFYSRNSCAMIREICAICGRFLTTKF